MKKFIVLLLCLIFSICTFSACNFDGANDLTDGGNNSGEQNSNYTPEDVVSAINDTCKIIRFGVSTYKTTLINVDVESVYNAFTEKGYTTINAPTIKGQINATKVLAAGNKLVTLYVKNNKVRVTWDICDTTTYSLMFPNEKTNTGFVTMAQIGVDRGSSTDNPAIGMCYVYKLSDGSAVIIDGGLSSNADEIYNTLKKLEIAKNSDGKYRISTWIITHGHSDHYGALETFAKDYKNYSDVAFIMHSLPMVDNAYALNNFDVKGFSDGISSHYPNSIYVVPHAGLRYFIGNITIDMLYTPDMLDVFSNYNDTSLLFSVKCGGKKVLHFGDATEKVATETWFAYERQAFTADVLQITHHGLYTGTNSHTWTNISRIYNSTGAVYALLPLGTRYSPDARNGRWTVLCEWAKKGYQTSFLINNLENNTNCVVSEQADWDKFVEDVKSGVSQYQTCLGYDGKNIIANKYGLTTYLMSTETENMATVFEFTGTDITIVANETLATWFN